MPASQFSINDLPGTTTQCIVGLARFASLLFVLELTIFAAIGPLTPADAPVIHQGGTSVHVDDSAFSPSSASEDSIAALTEMMRAVDDAIQVVAPLIVIILAPLLCLLVVISPFNREVECRYPFLALLTVLGMLPLILIDVPSAPWAASALPHSSNSLLLGGVVPLVATISMMSVAILIARRAGAHDVERVIANPAASRMTREIDGVRPEGGRSQFTSSPRRRRMP